MEAWFGHDLGRVRLRVEPSLAEAEGGPDTAAVTVGPEIQVASAALAQHPLLLVHELAHVAQQRASATAGTDPDAAEREAAAVTSAWARGAAVPAVSAFATAPMRQGMGNLRVAEANAQADARQRLRELAGRLLQVQLKADTLAPSLTGDENLRAQQQLLTGHLERLTAMLGKAGEGALVDASVFRGIEVGIDAGGLAVDLMYLDRLGAASGSSTVSRSGANRGLAWAWKAMRMVAADPLWPTASPDEAAECIRQATFHRDTVEDLLRTSAVLKAGVTAAQIVDMAVSAGQLLATGRAVLKALAAWLGEGGGGVGIIRAAAAGVPGTLVLVSGGRTLVLTAAQVEALVQAGLLSANALVLYNLARTGGTAGPVGPHGARPPGSKSRYSQEEIAKEYLEEAGKKVPAGERALQESGVVARQLRKVEEYHHLLVRQLRKWFRSRGIDIDRYTVRLSADEHRWIHNEYRWNELWKDFRLKNPNASVEEILAQMRALQKQVGLEGLEIVPYPR
jgi:hypothetical protein